jgi:2-succinyl-5-enolpyruvyl-6-hydroxy-3-cyclohexene-1-carboxylate synthase
MNLDFRNTNALWCSVAAETLARAGVRHAVISPGSRNTPLTLALVAHPDIATTPVLDERSAAFFGLGIAKRTGAPVVLLCTSGTAGANYLPAVIEAHESGTPLIVITADRPPEMRDCASGQTIDQQKLFSGFVRFYHELAVPEPRVELLRYLRQTLRHATERALRDCGGPVHLNAPFRDPLPPIEDDTAKGLVGAVEWGEFFKLPPADAKPGHEFAESAVLDAAAKGILVLGTGAPAEWERLARETGWPVLADPLSDARLRAPGGVTVIAAYDAILRDARAAERLRPEMVVLLGDIPTSKALRSWLGAVDAPGVQVTNGAGNRDALHGRTRRLALVPRAKGAPNSEWAANWSRAETGAQSVLAGAPEAFEGAFTRALAAALGREQTLVVASSMPVRDMEYLAPVRAEGPRVIANRGANGIDGTLSTALGVAHDGGPTVLLTGDLALLHDTNGFLAAAKLRGSLTAVVINNEGGGIFGHLPVAKFDPPFEEYWATPQRVDIAKLCAAYGVAHAVATSPAGLVEQVGATGGAAGVNVIEVRTDRARDAATRQRLFAEAARAAGDALG